MSSSATNDLLVMSYNISFEAMTNHSSGGSAHILGGNCKPVSHGSKLTTCARNMANMIDLVPSSIGVSNYDFVGMQEASRWSEMQKASKLLSTLTPYGSQYGQSEMVSFYDQSKYSLDKHADSGFDHDRPFQILVFSEFIGSSGVIFINAHCPHKYKSKSDPKIRLPYTYAEFSEHTESELQKLNLTTKELSYRVIAVGDFNETNWINGQLNPMKFKPFGPNYLNTEISIKNTPFTCCQPDGVWQKSNGDRRDGWRGGDYIFDSKQAADTKVPSVYPVDKLLSDHLPVIAILPS